jgi:hypothetical protein
MEEYQSMEGSLAAKSAGEGDVSNMRFQCGEIIPH